MIIIIIKILGDKNSDPPKSLLKIPPVFRKAIFEDFMNNELDKYSIIIKKIEDESGTYFKAEVLEFQNCYATGETINKALKELKTVMELWIKTTQDENRPIPSPIDDSYSGKFVLRLPKSLHKHLKCIADAEGISLNQYILYKLSQ